MNNPEILIIGHRGAMGYKPENTLASFELAIEMGCPWIELDVYIVDATLLVFHDETLERTTNGAGKLENHDLAYLRGLDAGDGEQIPTLGEVLDLVDGRVGVNIELKGAGTAGPVAALLDAYCEKGWHPEQFLISSFDHRELASTDPTYRRGALFGRRSRKDYFTAAEELGAWSINLDLALVKAETVRQAHEHGFRVLVYTVNQTKDLQAMIAMGVDGIFTNYPDKALKLL
ncbi:MAG: glycerophosphodiester phosphodiesterase family protein [Pseudomonadales bacterium]